MSKKRNTGKGAAGLAGSSTEGLRSTASAAPKPAKAKPTTGGEGGFYIKCGDILHKTSGIMWSSLCRYSECVMLERFVEAYRLGKKDSRRAIAAAVRKERERCMKIIADDFGTLNPGRVSVTIAKIRGGT